MTVMSQRMKAHDRRQKVAENIIRKEGHKMTTELTIIDQKPEAVVLAGKDAAIQLQRIVGSRAKKLMMGGKQYLFFEDWQTVGKFYGVTARVAGTSELRENDQLIGFLASAVAIVGGVEISGADAECTFDEPNWIGKPRYQLRSMAQTRACAKALRNCLGWVAVLAGYEATPAEEMSGVSQEKGEQEKSDNWCDIHDTEFFKRGKMKSFAHPIGDTGQWCYKHNSAPVIEATQSKSSPVKKESNTTAPTEFASLKNVGELLTRAQGYGITQKDVFEAVAEGTQTSVTKASDITDYDSAWTFVLVKFANAIQAYEDQSQIPF